MDTNRLINGLIEEVEIEDDKILRFKTRIECQFFNEESGLYQCRRRSQFGTCLTMNCFLCRACRLNWLKDNLDVSIEHESVNDITTKLQQLSQYFKEQDDENSYDDEYSYDDDSSEKEEESNSQPNKDSNTPANQEEESNSQPNTPKNLEESNTDRSIRYDNDLCYYIGSHLDYFESNTYNIIVTIKKLPSEEETNGKNH